jgi:succinyl-CoA synthetase beta subunit
MDWIDQMGARAASLVDIDPAIMAGQAAEGFRLALDAYDRDPAVQAILINVITAGYRLDDIVAALLPALATRASAKPAILHLYGNAMDNTPAMLAASGRRNAASLREAVAQVVAAVGG